MSTIPTLKEKFATVKMLRINKTMVNELNEIQENIHQRLDGTILAINEGLNTVDLVTAKFIGKEIDYNLGAIDGMDYLNGKIQQKDLIYPTKNGYKS